MIRKCEGPNGEPGWLWEQDGVQGGRFWYDPGVTMSKLRAEVAVTRAAGATFEGDRL